MKLSKHIIGRKNEIIQTKNMFTSRNHSEFPLFIFKRWICFIKIRHYFLHVRNLYITFADMKVSSMATNSLCYLVVFKRRLKRRLKMKSNGQND